MSLLLLDLAVAHLVLNLDLGRVTPRYPPPRGMTPCRACGLLRELNPGPLGPKPRIIPLDQAADGIRRLRD